MFDLNYFNMVSESSWLNPWFVNFMELAALVEIMFTNVRVTACIIIVIIIHFIPCRMFQHAQYQHYFRFFSFCNLVFLFCLCNCFGISSSLQFLQFGINFCNLVFLFYLCNCFGISSSLQFLQFGISFCNLVLASAIWYFCYVSTIFLVFRLLFSFCNLVFELIFCKKNLEWYFVFRFCKIWYFDYPSASAIWYFCLQLFWYFVFSSVSAIWYQLLQFGISVLSLQLFWYFVFSSVSAIWYLS